MTDEKPSRILTYAELKQNILETMSGKGIKDCQLVSLAIHNAEVYLLRSPHPPPNVLDDVFALENQIATGHLQHCQDQEHSQDLKNFIV